MGTKVKSGFCKQCNERRKIERERPSHLLHLILTILTFGIWLIVWIGVSIKFGGWRCATCGAKASGYIS